MGNSMEWIAISVPPHGIPTSIALRMGGDLQWLDTRLIGNIVYSSLTPSCLAIFLAALVCHICGLSHRSPAVGT